jgi:hypothetical protein
MSSQIIALVAKAASILAGFAALVIVFTVIALVLAPTLATGRRNRQAIFSLMTFVGIVAAGLFTLYRLL